MTVRTRVLACRLIEQIDANKKYAEKIGLSYSYKGLASEDKKAKEEKADTITNRNKGKPPILKKENIT